MKGIKGFQKGHTINVGKPCSKSTKNKIGLANKKNSYFIKCPKCKIIRQITSGLASRIANKKASKICNKCYKHKSNSTSFKKGLVPWNKGSNPNQLKTRRLYKLEWREKNRDKVNAYFRKYYDDNIEKGRLTRRASRIRRRAKFDGYFSVKILETLKKKHSKNGHVICYMCNKICDSFWEVDHKIPVSKNGSNHVSNLAIACRSCNRKKSNKLVQVMDS